LFNTHGSEFGYKAQTIVPLLSEFEEKRILINLEQRPQKTNEIFTRFFDARPIERIFSSLFKKLLNYDTYSNLKTIQGEKYNNYVYNFIYELVKYPFLFETMENVYTHVTYENIFHVNYVYKYPTKSNLEDFYCSNKWTKNSNIMQQSSQILRKNSLNFK